MLHVFAMEHKQFAVGGTSDEEKLLCTKKILCDHYDFKLPAEWVDYILI